MKYIIKKPDNTYTTMDVISNMPVLPLGYEAIGLEKDNQQLADLLQFSQSKVNQITTAYDLMNTEIFNQMYVVFATTRSDSASAYLETWKLMVQYAVEFKDLDLFDDLNNPLDTEQKIFNYATAKLLQAKDYAIYRLNRIKQFKIAKQAILDS